MKRTLALALGLVACGVGCAPRRGVPRDVRSLREQRGRATLTVPVWTVDVVDELTAEPTAYARKTLVVERAYLDPARPTQRAGSTLRFPLRGGGMAVLAAEDVPKWLRARTGAPLKLRAVVHPPRRNDEGRVTGELLLRGESIDLAHPLELTHVGVAEAADGTWLTARLENYRNKTAKATVEVRFGGPAHRQSVGPVPPGEARTVRTKLFGTETPPWTEWEPAERSLRLAFDDGTKVDLDLGKWLEPPLEGLLDWGYSHSGKSTAVLVLSRDRKDAELERFAALELRTFLHRFTDANIEPREPDDPEPLPKLPLLVVGTAVNHPLAAKLAAAAKLGPRIQSVGPDGYVLKRTAHEGRPTLLVTAQTARGLISGVYSLLARYGVRLTLSGARVPPRTRFELPDIDEARAPLFARRRLVAVGSQPRWTATWTQWEWLALFDAAGKNRFNEVVVPLDGLEATFAHTPGQSRGAVFPFEVGAYACVAEAALAHQRGLVVLADVARRRGLDLAFGVHDAKGVLRCAAPPACLGGRKTRGKPGEAIGVLRDPGDVLSMPRVHETAVAVAGIVDRPGAVLSVPYDPGARFRAGYLARFAWDRTLTPSAFYRSWASTVVEGEEGERLAKVAEAIDAFDGDLLAASPPPFGTGLAMALPVTAADLKCDWAALKARATSKEMAARIESLKKQTSSLRAVQRQADPVYGELEQALGGLREPWDEPMPEGASATRRADRIALRVYMLRALVGALASVQEGTLAYHAALAEPAEALAQLRVALSKYRKARRILLWIAGSDRWTAIEPRLVRLAAQLNGQATLLAEWLGPASDAEPSVRLGARGSKAVIQLFRTPDRDIYAVYCLSGHETAPLRLNAAEARVFRRGQSPTTLRATGGAFLLAIDTVPTYLVTRRAAWPGQPLP